MTQGNRQSSLYRVIWRWHFYAGLFIIPMVLILSVTGAMYLFKPQVERWEERAFQKLPTADTVAPSIQRDAALAAYPGSKFLYYRLPERTGDAALVHLRVRGEGQVLRDVFVSPQGKVLGALDPDRRIMEIARDIHGQLMLGHRGSWLVELAASWAIVLMVSGLYLWCPKGTGLSGVFWPRFGLGRRILLRDLHAVTGFWVAGFALVLLLTGLPWAEVWGSGFKAIRTEMGWIKGEQDWTIGGRAVAGEHAMHMNGASTMQQGRAREPFPPRSLYATNHPASTAVGLDLVVARAETENLVFPVIVAPPEGSDSPWTTRSDSQNRPLRVTLRYDPRNGRELSRETFDDKHVIDRVVGYGVAWHEGQLFGLANQLIGTLTAVALITLSVTGFLSWRRRKPEGRLGAPPPLPARLDGIGIRLVAAVLLLGLPMFTISAAILWLLDRFVLPHLPVLARWLGVREAWKCQDPSSPPHSEALK